MILLRYALKSSVVSVLAIATGVLEGQPAVDSSTYIDVSQIVDDVPLPGQG